MARILLIDDSPSALQTVAGILEEAGYEVETCGEGKGAVQLLRHNRFDLIITDIYMSDEDGLEVMWEARQICPTVPVVAVSGVTGVGNMLGVAKYLGACQTVRKPFSSRDLLNAVGAALGGIPKQDLAREGG